MGERLGVRGRVLAEDGRPVAGIRVDLAPGPRSTETAADGSFAFVGLERRSYQVWARDGDRCTPIARVEPEDEVELQLGRGITLLVRVTADGAPLPGARVVLRYGLGAITDDHGVATIRGIYPWFDRVDVAAPGRAPRDFVLQLLGLAGDVAVVERTIELPRGAEISGRLIDRHGDPVDGLPVVLAGDAGAVHTFSNADGTWRIVASAGRYRITAGRRSRRTFEEITIDHDGAMPRGDLVLRIGNPATGGGRIAGVVVDEHGRPADGAHVCVVDPAAPRSLMGEWRGAVDREGRFETCELDDGDYDVHASWGSMRHHEIQHRARAGETALRLVLLTGATVTGRALLDGAPLRYFGVRVSPHPDGVSPVSVRSEEGRFTVRHVPPGPARVLLLGPGTDISTTEIEVTGDETIDLGEVALVRGRRVTGCVRDRRGAPVAGASVRVAWSATSPSSESTQSRIERWFWGWYSTVTDDTGAYAFDGLSVSSPSPEHRDTTFPQVIWASHPRVGESLVQRVPDADATIDFVLVGRGRIEGRVGHRAGVHATRVDEPPDARMAVAFEGRFWLDVPPGEYVVHDHSPDPQNPTSVTVTVLEGQTVSVALDSTPKTDAETPG